MYVGISLFLSVLISSFPIVFILFILVPPLAISPFRSSGIAFVSSVFIYVCVYVFIS